MLVLNLPFKALMFLTLMSLMENTLDWMNRNRSHPWLYRQGERVVWHMLSRHRRADPDAQFEGSWYGNDTIWRTCLDLNRALLYADAGGQMHDTPRREEISIVDAIVSGQGEGPLDPTPLETGALFAAHNPAVGDYVGAHALGFDPAKIPLVRHAFDGMRWRICANAPRLPEFGAPFPPARPPRGWAGHIERDREQVR